jgi:hypothetical protein
LRQREGATSDTVNPLQPYFLVYIQDDGVVRFSFTHPKQILDILREFCAGCSAPYEELCRAFDQETRNGTAMQWYDDLLAKALRSIENHFRKRVVSSLLTDRQAVLPNASEQVNEQTDFELITWLIIRG